MEPHSVESASLLVVNAAIALLGLLLAFALPDSGRRFFGSMERWFGRLAGRPALAVLLVGVSAPVIRLALLPIAPIPQPVVQDEFSFLLAGETFASHRLTNPTPPMWVHFETFHEDFQPTYMSMYPPAQGLFLAAGAVLFRHPWFGVCLGIGAMCAAICWMLQGWFSPGWALYGAVLVVLRLGVFSFWMNSYYGGAVAAAGGALVLGAMPRLMRRVRVHTALVLGFGLVILANSRPFEGLLVSLPVAGALLLWAFGKKHPPAWILCKRFALPVLVVFLIAAGAMGYYNWRVFGNPMTMPYQINRFEFLTKIEDDTKDMFHCLSLTLGTKARVSSLRDAANNLVLEDCDTIVLPACFGPYVLENLGDGQCEVIKTTLITEPRAHIDKEREERDWGQG